MIEVTLPVSCAPYLINGDDNDGRAVYEADQRCAALNLDPQACLSVDHKRIGRFHGQIAEIANFIFDADR